MKSLIVTVVSALCTAFAGFADTIEYTTWDGSGDWPTEGNIKLVGKVTVDTADKAAAIAGWENLWLPQGYTITIENAAGKFTLKANIEGGGSINVNEAEELTISGNSKTRSGTWTFTDSYVHVASEYGLGGSSAQTKVVYNDAGTYGGLDFYWDGQNAFTNHCALVFSRTTGTGTNTKVKPGSRSNDEYFVQDASLQLEKAGSYNFAICFRGNYEQISGTFGYVSYSGNYFGTYVSGANSVRFSGSTKFHMGQTDLNYYQSAFYIFGLETSKTYFSSNGGAYFGELIWDKGQIVIENGDAFKPYETKNLKEYGAVSLNPYLDDACVCDLSGQTVAVHRLDRGATTTDKKCPTFTSATPATLKLVGARITSSSTPASDASIESRTLVAKFTDQISFYIDNNRTNIFINNVSSPNGTLSVMTNAALVYRDNAGWNGTAAVINGGYVDAESTESFSGGNTTLEIKNGGVLKLHSGSDVLFRTAKLGETTLSEGEYTVAELAEMGLGAYVTGDADAKLTIANWYTFDGTGTWPTEGNIKVPASTVITIDTADKAAAVAGWSRIWLTAATSKIDYRNSTFDATLNAAVEGKGVIKAVGAQKLTLTGNSSTFTGSCNFENSEIYVNNEYGLGGKKSGETQMTINATQGSLHFIPEAGMTAITNHVAVLWYPTVSSTARIEIGSESTDQYFVQDGNMRTVSAYTVNIKINFRYNYEQISGMLGPRDYSANWLGWNASQSPAVVRFSGTTEIWAGGFSKGVASPKTIYILSGGEYHFGSSGGIFVASFNPNSAKIFIDSEDGFKVHPDMPEGTAMVYSPYQMSSDSYYLDLNGYDFVQKQFKAQQTYTAMPDYHEVVTDTKGGGVFKLEGDLAGADTAAYAYKFMGKASLLVNNNATNTIAKYVSDTTGTCTIKTGVLKFTNGAGWTGGKVVVDGGSLYIANDKSGVDSQFARLIINGEELGYGTYTISDLKAKYGAAVLGDDAASIKVTGPTEFEGWPTEQGGIAWVVGDVTVDDEDDVAGVQRAGRIIIPSGSKLNIAADVAFDISANIEGSGKVRIIDQATPITISGDNSKLVSPGGFYITNSYVCVSNEYGLGGLQTAAVDIYYGKETERPVIFGLKNSNYFTNNVAINAYSTDKADTTFHMMIGSESADEYLVQNAAFTQKHVDSKKGAYLRVKGNVEFNGALNFNWYMTWISSKPGTVIKYGPNCVLNCVSGHKMVSLWQYSSDRTADCITKWIYGSQNFAKYAATVAVHIGEFVADCDYPFGSAADTGASFYFYCNRGNNDSLMTSMDLKDHTVAMALGSEDGAWPTTYKNNKSRYGEVKGSGTLEVKTSAATDNKTNQIKFKENASWHFVGPGTNMLINIASESKGLFRVSDGTSGFAWGATWAGDVTVDGTGTLWIDAESMAANVFGRRKTTTVLKVKDSAVVKLEAGQAMVRNCYVGDSATPLAAGIYAASDSELEGVTKVNWITGEGTLKVLGDKKMFVIFFK